MGQTAQNVGTARAAMIAPLARTARFAKAAADAAIALAAGIARNAGTARLALIMNQVDFTEKILTYTAAPIVRIALG
ncbi:hypothetical protein A1F94_003284 [Pyrenophora tritici-repentis]|nr:hypothetical protein A1F94_003284 [Pyrenophora tritici-repentis]